MTRRRLPSLRSRSDRVRSGVPQSRRAYRHIVSPCAAATARRLPETVLSMRTTCDRNGVWHMGDARSAWKARQQRILDKLESNPRAHLLVMDVAQYYPSLSAADR